jgi:16S rRNA G966 N2-methylase RsmD
MKKTKANWRNVKVSSENRYQNGNDECATPTWIKEGIFAGWYDPCPLSQGLVERDGLNSNWESDKIFINPPYSKPMPWVEKAIIESKKGKTVALLVKHDSSTQWWAKLYEAGGHFLHS